MSAGGLLWFTEFAGGKLGSIATGGTIVEFSLPDAGPHQLAGITLGADGKLWFIDFAQGKVGSFDPIAHVFAEFSTSAIQLGVFITSGADGNLYLTDVNSNSIDRLVY